VRTIHTMLAEPQNDAQAVLEAEDARRLRAIRDAQLSPDERLARVHELCRQLASIRPARVRER
jgi:hypothetical protein